MTFDQERLIKEDVIRMLRERIERAQRRREQAPPNRDHMNTRQLYRAMQRDEGDPDA